MIFCNFFLIFFLKNLYKLLECTWAAFFKLRNERLAFSKSFAIIIDEGRGRETLIKAVIDFVFKRGIVKKCHSAAGDPPRSS